MLRALVLALLVCAGPGAAQSDRVELEWNRWLEQQGSPDGALIFMIGDSVLLAAENGVQVDAPVPLASLSKAITAHCVRSLVEDGALDWRDNLRHFFFTDSTATLAEVVTHAGGLWPDETQGPMAAWRGDPTPRWMEVSAQALTRAAEEVTRGAYRYNNENYAVLGAIIEDVTGAPYDRFCAGRVLAPLGITTARLSPEYGGFGPWGGWEMSVRDYARFVRGAVIAGPALEGPHADVGDGAFYGLGIQFRTGRGAPDRWHFGALCFADGGLGSFAVNWGGKYTIVAAYDACVGEAAMQALHRSLARAVFAD